MPQTTLNNTNVGPIEAHLRVQGLLADSLPTLERYIEISTKLMTSIRVLVQLVKAGRVMPGYKQDGGYQRVYDRAAPVATKCPPVRRASAQW
jgi:hypothetical protein